ncbi:DUF6134 family protein [Acidisphaera sp. L21]|uniref:DUF6134 family protein n=1 Tax=Acidisphaera sp. L21 TaxID=1641851 RepID=UPI00131D68FB|nr:DUF6134 family protein [Acidisphaera sp. L21]
MTLKPACTALFALAAFAAPHKAHAAAPLPTCPVTNGKVASYDIVRNGNVIGHESFRWAINGPDTTVTVDVNASLHALGIRVYHYEHHGEEKWHAGQLVALATNTDDDGIPRHVQVVRDPGGAWHGIVGAQPGPGPLIDSNVWNDQIVQQSRLLNHETGEVVPLHTSSAGEQSVKLSDRQVTATQYELAGPVKGTVWYDGNGCLVQAMFHTKVDGSLIEMQAR